MNKHLPPDTVRELGTIPAGTIGARPISPDLHLEEGICINGRCVWGFEVGFITRVDRETFTIGWRDGETTLLRPDDEEE